MDHMVDSLLHDVQRLMDIGFGDDRILRQIYRACKNNEAISNYERNYVRTLVDEHLTKSAQIPEPEPEKEIPAHPGAVVPNPALPQLVVKTKPQRGFKGIMSWSMRRKLVLGIAALLLIGAITAAASFNSTTGGVFPLPSPPVDPPPDVIPPPPLEMPAFSVATDLVSYDRLDLILISGASVDSDAITLSIVSPDGQTIWAETVSVRDNRYSTLTIAGGMGWDDSGVYTLEAFNGVDRAFGEFTFNP